MFGAVWPVLVTVHDPDRPDVRDFFGALPQWEVLRRLRDVIDDERVIHVVGMLLGEGRQFAAIVPSVRNV